MTDAVASFDDVVVHEPAFVSSGDDDHDHRGHAAGDTVWWVLGNGPPITIVALMPQGKVRVKYALPEGGEHEFVSWCDNFMKKPTAFQLADNGLKAA